MGTTTEVTRAMGREPSPLVATATARTWDTTTRRRLAGATARSVVEEGEDSTPAPVMVRDQQETVEGRMVLGQEGDVLRTVAEDGLQTVEDWMVLGQEEGVFRTVEDWMVPGSLVAPTTPGLAVRAEMPGKDTELGPAEDFPARREAGGVEVEREEATGEDRVVDTTDVAEEGTEDSEEEAVAEVEERDASKPGVKERETGREGEVSKAGAKEEEEPGEEGDEVAGSRGRPSSSTAW